MNLMDRIKAIEDLKKAEGDKKELPSSEQKVAFMMNNGPNKDGMTSLIEQQNRVRFKNYVPKDNIEWKSSYQSKYDNSMDRPMVFLGQGSGQREISTDLIRQTIDDNPQFFRDIDQSNYAKLQDTIQKSYRSGGMGVNILDNLILRGQGVDPIGKVPMNFATNAISR